MAGSGTQVNGEIILSDAANPRLLPIPVDCASTGGLMFGAVGVVGGALAEADSVLRSAASYSAVIIGKAKWQ